MELNKEEKRILLNAARLNIGLIFNGIKPEEPEYDKYPTLKSKCGVFVTLTIKGKLRGCIGYVISDKPLYKTLCDAAVQSATGDPRFSPLSKEEFDAIEIEISVLSEPFAMKSYNEIVIGKHGLIVDEIGRKGLLLPQVPIEHNMNRDEYLSALCEKAGLPYDFWKEKTININMFTATVFSEKEMGA